MRVQVASEPATGGREGSRPHVVQVPAAAVQPSRMQGGGIGGEVISGTVVTV